MRVPVAALSAESNGDGQLPVKPLSAGSGTTVTLSITTGGAQTLAAGYGWAFVQNTSDTAVDFYFGSNAAKAGTLNPFGGSVLLGCVGGIPYNGPVTFKHAAGTTKMVQVTTP